MRGIIFKLMGMFWNFPGSVPVPPTTDNFLLLDGTDFLLLDGSNLLTLGP